MTCTHRGGWSARTRGEARCRDCGTVRFTEYAALRPPGLPHAATPPRRSAVAADRAATRREGCALRACALVGVEFRGSGGG
ncbi:DUF6255 family natural product biosynthesis protein [Streptomyces roseifaciens]|uniref:DUF6255 family natural product biosynthesis protein n=1 Tax=Streptomyces roseifaciens TaxID=1488406 RepID=UPI003B8306D6